ncbi:MAG: uracil-DNA glycosylase [Verrucomicrobiales bacterium]
MPAPKKSQFLQELGDKIRVCPLCPLCESRTLAVPGEGNITSKAMIIGEAPGKDEDNSGHPFVGSAGKYLDHVLEGSNISRSDFFITNIVKCRPPKNRQPRVNEVDICTSNYLFRQIEIINPSLVVLLGGVAAKKLLGVKKVEEVRGKFTEHEGRRYFVTYHPAVRFYRDDLAKKLEEDFLLLKSEMERLKAM